MHLSELGIDSKTGQHVKNPLTKEENAFLGVLWVDHVGKENKISSEHLALAFAQEITGVYAKSRIKHWMRDVRRMHNHLLFDHNIPILSKAGKGGGYWMAADEEEGKEFYATFRKRGMTALMKATRGKQTSMVDAVTQLTFEFDSQVNMTEEAGNKPASRQATPIEVVDAFLRKMMEDPEQYADGLRRIGDKYGSVLIPKKRYDETVSAILDRLGEAEKMAESLRI